MSLQDRGHPADGDSVLLYPDWGTVLGSSMHIFEVSGCRGINQDRTRSQPQSLCTLFTKFLLHRSTWEMKLAQTPHSLLGETVGACHSESCLVYP